MTETESILELDCTNVKVVDFKPTLASFLAAANVTDQWKREGEIDVGKTRHLNRDRHHQTQRAIVM
jgi:hypothetical protein